MSSGIDWDKLKIEYVTTDISYRKIADKYGIPFRTLSEAAIRCGWKKAKEQYRKKVVTKTLNRVSDLEADKLAKLVRISDGLEEMIERAVNIRILPENCENSYTTQDIRNIAASVKDALTIKRNIYHLPTFAEAENSEIARRRIELEERKLAVIEKQTDKQAEAIEIIFSEDGERLSE